LMKGLPLSVLSIASDAKNIPDHLAGSLPTLRKLSLSSTTQLNLLKLDCISLAISSSDLPLVFTLGCLVVMVSNCTLELFIVISN
jgi:hypothetical protein